MTERKPTSFDIAHLAGVSQATVSRALRDSPLVSRDTRLKVQKIATELNYTVDRSASSLRTGQSHTLALLLFEDAGSDESSINPFFLSMLGSITRASAARGYDLLVSFQQLEENWHAHYEEAHRADGLILLGYGDYLDARPVLKRLAESGGHFVLWGPVVEDQPDTSVGVDNFQGGYQATRHLLALGRRHIAFLGTPDQGAPEFAARYQGYRSALEEAGLGGGPLVQADADNSELSGSVAMAQILQDGTTVDGLFCASDLIAIGALNRLRQTGLSVPGQISVVGFDDIAAAAYCSPALSTMRQDTGEAGTLLVELLIGQISGSAVQSRLLQPHLVIRESCGADRDA